MTNITAIAKQDGPAAPSSLTINVAELLSLLAIGGRLTLLVDPVSTALSSTVTPRAPAPAADSPGTSGDEEVAVAAVSTELIPAPAADSSGFFGDEEVASAAAITVPDPISEATQSSATSLTFAQEAALDEDDSEAQVSNKESRRREPVIISDSEDEFDDPNTRWYYITRGREIGVFAGWHKVAPLVMSVPGSCFARTKTRTDAVKIFTKAFNSGDVAVVPF
ncbi:hypothetical protein FPV67DRAFT_1762076 [Lyophyllum atratum]|nr:hypothetical protein FPV67DRAFT_1762076 [Lyophyllum atratum]